VKRSTDRILTTHAGSLPRPDDLARMMWDTIDGTPVDRSRLDARVKDAVAEAVQQQLEAGIDIVSDGEMSKVGFNTYVTQRFSGFANRAQFVRTDLAEIPGLAQKLFGSPGANRFIMPNVEGPIALTDPAAVAKDIANFKAALGGGAPTMPSSPPSRRDRCASIFRTNTIRPTRPISRRRAKRCASNTRRSSRRASSSARFA
jgi:5-methyltetrahydropteroyltriglutamate--homocysteine methyltransferase